MDQLVKMGEPAITKAIYFHEDNVALEFLKQNILLTEDIVGQLNNVLEATTLVTGKDKVVLGELVKELTEKYNKIAERIDFLD